MSVNATESAETREEAEEERLSDTASETAEEVEEVEEVLDEVEDAADDALSAAEGAAQAAEDAEQASIDANAEAHQTLQAIEACNAAMSELTQELRGFSEFMRSLTIEERSEEEAPVIETTTETTTETGESDNGNGAETRRAGRSYRSPIGRRRR